MENSAEQLKISNKQEIALPMLKKKSSSLNGDEVAGKEDVSKSPLNVKTPHSLQANDKVLNLLEESLKAKGNARKKIRRFNTVNMGSFRRKIISTAISPRPVNSKRR